MKYFLIITFIISSGAIGKIIESKYKKRVNLYKELIKFADFLTINIYSLHEDIILIINKFLENEPKLIKEDFENIKKLIIEGGVSVQTLQKIKMMNDATSQELIDICEFFSMLGKNNLDTQISLIENYKHIFSIRKDEADEELKRKGKMSFKMSVCAGVMLSVLII